MVLTKLIAKFVKSKSERDHLKLMPVVEKVKAFRPEYEALDDDALRAKTTEFKERIEAGETVDDLLPEAFAVVWETCRRFTERGETWKVMGHDTTWAMVPYDVQIIGGVALHQGRIAEMATGEGKTLVATMPVYLNALTGKGVHVVTVNDYLAQRDSEWMGGIYQWLGLSVGSIRSQMTPEQRRVSYNSDIVYGTNNEFGFDYLRDNMAVRVDDLVQRGHYYAIVDEVDSVLIDEARTPLIHQRVEVTIDIDDADRLVVLLELATDQDLEEFFIGSGTAGEDDECVAAFFQQSLALAHGGHDDELFDVFISLLPFQQVVGDDSGDSAAAGAHGSADLTHETDFAAAMNKRQPAASHLGAQLARGVVKDRIECVGRRTIDRHGLYG